LLKILAERPGVVFSREDLSNYLALDSGERAIDVQVNRLRQKIELDPKSPRYLQTVRGRGYILRPD
jgi:two-component system phosphate regulon response regulator OmpR